MLLVIGEPVVWIKLETARQVIVMKDLSKCLQHITAMIRKSMHYVDKVTPGVGQAVAQYHVERPGCVPAERVAHLNGRPELLVALGQQVGQILTRMLASGEKQRDQMLAAIAHNA